MSSVLVTGGGGYIGTELTEELLARGHKVTCIDRLFFGFDVVAEFVANPNYTLVRDDVRWFDPALLDGVDVVIDLAGISNDPSCDLSPSMTEEINWQGALRVARLAKDHGVKRFLFSSSCSVYGQGAKVGLTEESELRPVSLYAKCKARAEEGLLEMASEGFCVTILRNATAYGYSRRMRYDLVVNLMTAKGFHDRVIYVLGGGEQWRPNVHVRDVAEAFLLVMGKPTEEVAGQIFNVGSDEQTFRVIDIAHIVREKLGNVRIEIVPDDPDKRTYNVSFEKIRCQLGFRAEHTIEQTVEELRNRLAHGTVRPFSDTRTRTLDYYLWLLQAKATLDEVCIGERLL
jgi:nucleoside-diphosphate-sugar epimerase